MKQLKILSVGNSFSWDTMEYVAEIAFSCGYESVKLGNLYAGGCSVKKHFYHAENDLAAYEYRENNGNGWQSSCGHKISDTVKSETWDWISIQHGTLDGSRYTDPESYSKLNDLCAYLKDLSPDAGIAFNMTWVGEMSFPHPEIASYNGDQLKMYRGIADVMQNTVLPIPYINKVVPTGTAIQNARTANIGLLTRDGFHLSPDVGRYIAGLTFFSSLTGADISNIDFSPEGVSEHIKCIAIESAINALKTPFSVTESKIV